MEEGTAGGRPSNDPEIVGYGKSRPRTKPEHAAPIFSWRHKSLLLMGLSYRATRRRHTALSSISMQCGRIFRLIADFFCRALLVILMAAKPPEDLLVPQFRQYCVTWTQVLRPLTLASG